jgi:hypothetical protein
MSPSLPQGRVHLRSVAVAFAARPFTLLEAGKFARAFFDGVQLLSSITTWHRTRITVSVKRVTAGRYFNARPA